LPIGCDDNGHQVSAMPSAAAMFQILKSFGVPKHTTSGGAPYYIGLVVLTRLVENNWRADFGKIVIKIG
jgi:hypothetical protein